jgi:hypothetical protein
LLLIALALLPEVLALGLEGLAELLEPLGQLPVAQSLHVGPVVGTHRPRRVAQLVGHVLEPLPSCLCGCCSTFFLNFAELFFLSFFFLVLGQRRLVWTTIGMERDQVTKGL